MVFDDLTAVPARINRPHDAAAMARRELVQVKERLAALRCEIQLRALAQPGCAGTATLRSLVMAELALLVVVRQSLQRWLIALANTARADPQ